MEGPEGNRGFLGRNGEEVKKLVGLSLDLDLPRWERQI